jgi:hypothetical protein
MPQAVLWARPGRPLVPVVMGTVNFNSAGEYPNHRMTLSFVVHLRSVETWNLSIPSYRIQVKKHRLKKSGKEVKEKRPFEKNLRA